ncbi:MAG: LysM peptidoglycan-binding domain-containing protein [Bacteroidota bacterium]
MTGTILPLLRACRLALLALLLAASGLVPDSWAQERPATHVVQRGETLFGIAQTYGIDLADLRAANALLNNQIQIGQTLRIPGPTPPPPPSPPTSLLADAPPVPAVANDAGALVHTIRPGETLYRLTVWYDVTLDQLRAWNGLTSNTLLVGQEVVVRLASATPEPVAAATPSPASEAPTSAPAPSLPAPPPTAADSPEIGDGTGGTIPSASPPTTGDAPDAAAAPAAPPLSTGGLSDADLADEDGEAPPSASVPVTPVPALPPPRALQPAEAVQLAATPSQFVMTDTTVPADEVHLVRRGETLYAVAARYQVATQTLVDANPDLTTAPLVAGQMLHLPDSVGTMQYHRTIQASLPPPLETGAVLVYPDGLAGQATASGVAYDPDAYLASHRDLPFGSVVLVTNTATQRSTFVRIVDQGPVSAQFVMELSRQAAEALGIDPDGTGRVEIRQVP